MEDENLQIQITKFLDGQITPEERETLQRYLDKDPDTEKFFQEMVRLNEQGKQAVTTEVLNKGLTFDEIFTKSLWHWRTSQINTGKPLIHWLRFATGLAAGLAIGLGVHFSLTRPEAGINTYPTNIVNNRADPTAIQNPAVQFRRFNRPQVIHNVDWYYMTNDTGDKWLIEGHRDGLARPVINYGDL